jgi:tRNA(fMet)-specific endonuclease VapC
VLRYLLDTNIAIFVLRNRSAQLQARFVEARGELAVSSVSVAELAYGAEKSERPTENRRAVEEFLALLDVLDFDSAAASHSGQIRASLAAAGTPIGGYDVLIAGHARSRGLVVVTNNTREFERVSGLLVEDWSG